MKRLVPYPTVAGPVELAVVRVRVDDWTLPVQLVNTTDRIVALHTDRGTDWNEARLTVAVTTAPGALRPEHHGRDQACTAVLRERATNSVTAVRLHPDGSGAWTGEVSLDHTRHAGRVLLEAHLTATVDDVAGRIIGSTEPWNVDLEARTPTAVRTVRLVQVDFAADDRPELHRFRADPWHVDAWGDPPVLYLNKAFEGLVDLLHADASPTRDTVAAQVGVDVWSTLFLAALGAAAESGDDEPAVPGGWHGTVLKRMLPDVFPDLSPADALAEALKRRREGDAGFHALVLHAAGRPARLNPMLGGAIRALRRASESGR
ncbi:hypothetical protein [Yinghuangia seranimata]|uniref:hypothetical protein n=1 Tax=Yinghuangia seranimata TaxID=408067 RepID=UPI00248B69FA|nr:hypothetical protein [Yinghuangia seranimata]MDI2130873.1 hypothetical protein [Yinghuangia seranimata]